VGKKKSATQTTAQYQYVTPPPNPYFKSAEDLISGYDGGAAQAREGAMRNENLINEGGNNFFGPNQSAEVTDKIRSSRLFSNNLELGRNLADAKQNELTYKNSGYMSLGGATAPQLVQTGGTANSQQWGGLGQNFVNSLSAGAGGALAA